MRFLSPFLRLFPLLALVLAFLVWGLPWVLRESPARCARWHLTTGVCGERVRTVLERIDEVVARTIRPHARSERLEQVYARATRAFMSVEGQARRGLGDEAVDSALRGVEIALRDMEHLLDSGKTKDKVMDIPPNAQKLVRDVRDTLERLRHILSKTERRAEEVTTAVENARKALDALSKILPSAHEQ